MRILDRYLARAVIVGSLATLAALLPLVAFFMLADEADGIGINDYDLAHAMLYVVLSLPRHAYQLLPIATLIGALVGLGALASRSELVAMRAAGVSVARICAGALLGGLLLALGALLLGEGLAPLSDARALALRASAKAGTTVQLTASGFWARDGDAFVHIREIGADARLHEIVIYRLAGTRLRLALYASGAHYQDGHWILEDIRQARIDEASVTLEHLASATWNSLLDPDLLRVVPIEPHALPIWGLARYLRFLRASEQDAARYAVAFWSKAVHPLLVLAMIFLAIPVLLGSTRSRGQGLKILLGVLIGIAFYLVSRVFAYLALLYGFSPAGAAVLPPLLFVAGAAWLLRRVG